MRDRPNRRVERPQARDDVRSDRPRSCGASSREPRCDRSPQPRRTAPLLVRRGEDLQTADLSEAELRAYRRRGATVPLDDRSGTAVGAGVREPARDERRIEAVTAVLL